MLKGFFYFLFGTAGLTDKQISTWTYTVYKVRMSLDRLSVNYLVEFNRNAVILVAFVLYLSFLPDKHSGQILYNNLSGTCYIKS